MGPGDTKQNACPIPAAGERYKSTVRKVQTKKSPLKSGPSCKKQHLNYFSFISL